MSFAIYLLILGAIIYVLNYLNISVSYFKISFGFALVVIGVQTILSALNIPSLGRQTDSQAIFLNSRFHYPNPQGTNSFYTFFAKSDLDLNQIDISRGDIALTINNSIGETQVIVNPEMPLEIRVKNKFFSKIIDPDGNPLKGQTVKFYSPANVQLRPSKLILNLNSVGGTVMIVRGETLYKRK